jgi:hypothetical protein
VPKVIEPHADFGGRELLGFGDSVWAKISCHIPHGQLSAAANAQLRACVSDCVSWLLTQQSRIREGRELATPGRRREAKQLAKCLRSAANALSENRPIHGADNVLDHRRGTKRLETMAESAERDADRKPVTVPSPWPVFVRKLAQCCRDVGLNPTVTGRVYQSSWGIRPTWFQNFVRAVQDELLGDDGKKPHSPAAFAAEIAAALRGEKNSRKPRE